MPSKIIPLKFFAEDSTKIARKLIGKIIAVKDSRGRVQKFWIVETEAYRQDDPASHAFSGKSARNEAMFGPAGIAYVYLIYGMYHCLNIVTGGHGDGQAVLIRALAPFDEDLDVRTLAGPGKICRFLGIDRSWTGMAFKKSERLWLEDTGKKPPVKISKRIGITKAAHKEWRFCWKDHPALSRPG